MTPILICSKDSGIILEKMEQGCIPCDAPRKRWEVEKRDVRIDDIVFVADSNAIRGKWTIGRIIEVYPGSD